MLLISFLYFMTRLVNLTLLPIFNDEAIYLDWGWQEISVKGQMFYSLADAKQPLLMWIFGFLQKIFADPLVAGRTVSVIFGYLTLWGIYLLGKECFSKKTALMACLFYIITPIFLFYDRQALMESAIACIGVWAAYFFLKLYRENKTKDAIILGIILGLGFFIKSSSLIFFVTILSTSIWLFVKKDKKQVSVANLFLSLFISQIILLPLYCQSAFWQTLSTNSRFSLTAYELIRLPVVTWWNNFIGATEIIFWQMTPVIFLMAIIGTVIFMKKNKKDETRILLIWLFFSLLVVILTVRNISPRYLVSFLPLVIIFAADWSSSFINYFTVVVVGLVAFLQIFSPIGYFSLLNGLTRYSQKNEYITGWTSGYGVKEAIVYIENRSAGQPAFVGVRMDAGNPENAVFAYLYSSKNLRPVYFDGRIFNIDLNNYTCLGSKIPIYFISRENQLAGMDKFLIEEKKFYKPEGKSYIGVYQLKTDCQGTVLQLN